jgi:hypothetical protein
MHHLKKTEGIMMIVTGPLNEARLLSCDVMEARVTSAGIAVAATKLSFIPYSDAVALLTTLGAVGFTIEAGAMQAADNGYGDHFNELWSGVPLGLYGNTP